MFQINLTKLSAFDTQVMTLIELSPNSWMPGSAPGLVCHHKDLGWFHRHWIFGVQPLIISPGSNRTRSLTWRGQILLRRKVREIRRSAIDLNVPAAVAPDPSKNVAVSPLIPTPIAGAFGPSTASSLQAAQERQNNLMQAMVQQRDSHMADAFRFQLQGLRASPSPFETHQMSDSTASNALLVNCLGGYSRDELLAKGCPPGDVTDALHGSARAQDRVLEWVGQHM